MSNHPRPLTRQRHSAVWILTCCLTLLLVPTARAAAQSSDLPLVVFGDSISDSGNAFSAIHTNATPPDFGLNAFLVPQAPYAMGGHHFTNGNTWIEQLAMRFGIGRSTLPAFASANPHAMNFAVATARARVTPCNPAAAFCNPSLAFEIAAFLQKTGGVAPPGTLYVIQIGANDVRDALDLAFTDPVGAAQVLASAAQAIADGIRTLYAAGGRHFLVWNVPSPAITPAVRFLDQLRPGLRDAAALAGGLFNNFYAAPALLGASTLPGIRIRQFNADALLAAAYLQPALFGFTNVTDACVTPDVPPFRCQTPDQFLFWDGIHPTAATHALIARAVAQLFGY
jgi:outer membrane lipase/esterase